MAMFGDRPLSMKRRYFIESGSVFFLLVSAKFKLHSVGFPPDVGVVFGHL